ncbi:ribosomal protein L38e [Exophiala viscosa]|uniref:ribosomal protein L38e n=1 Tax=Exophiala viscosa TaxID=2486360 RepID=UPI00219D955E|nr:ribosomal protein L38e [Exophiala viscosa]
MPSEVTDIKQFLEIARRKDAKGARLKKSSKSKDIKLKIRCKRYLYTLILKDSDKADKIKQSLPPKELSTHTKETGEESGQYNPKTLPKDDQDPGQAETATLTIYVLTSFLPAAMPFQEISNKTKKAKKA